MLILKQSFKEIVLRFGKFFDLKEEVPTELKEVRKFKIKCPICEQLAIVPYGTLSTFLNKNKKWNCFPCAQKYRGKLDTAPIIKDIKEYNEIKKNRGKRTNLLEVSKKNHVQLLAEKYKSIAKIIDIEYFGENRENNWNCIVEYEDGTTASIYRGRLNTHLRTGTKLLSKTEIDKKVTHSLETIRKNCHPNIIREVESSGPLSRQRRFEVTCDHCNEPTIKTIRALRGIKDNGATRVLCDKCLNDDLIKIKRFNKRTFNGQDPKVFIHLTDLEFIQLKYKNVADIIRFQSDDTETKPSKRVVIFKCICNEEFSVNLSYLRIPFEKHNRYYCRDCRKITKREKN